MPIHDAGPRSLARYALLGILLATLFPGVAVGAPATGLAGSDSLPAGVCYEVFVRSFADSDGDGTGDLAGLISRLNYINDGDPKTRNDLGATCIWLMPVFEATSYHGYDVENYYAIESDYGTLEDFDRFLEAAHARGIRVILDLVLNHTSVSNPWFQEALRNPDSPFRDWYIFARDDPGYPGPWGAEAWHKSPSGAEFYYGVFWSGMPDLNYRNATVTQEARRITAFWLDKGVDGFRLDAIKHLIEDGKEQENTPETHAWLADYRAWFEAAYPDAFTIGEIFNASATLLQPYYDPPQLNAYFQFDLAGQAIIAAQQGVGDGLAYVVTDALERQPLAPWGTFLTNHDQNRVMSVLGDDLNQAKLAASVLLTMPGLPFVYYGEEIGMTGTKPDERIRTPMQWNGSETGGFTTGMPWQALQNDVATVNVAIQNEDPQSLLSHYRTLIHLRVDNPALASGDYLSVATSERSVLAFLRRTGDQTVLVVIAFGDTRITDPTLRIVADTLPAAEHTVTSLFGFAESGSLSVDGEGGITFHSGLTLEPQSTYIFQLDEPTAS